MATPNAARPKRRRIEHDVTAGLAMVKELRRQGARKAAENRNSTALRLQMTNIDMQLRRLRPHISDAAAKAGPQGRQTMALLNRVITKAQSAAAVNIKNAATAGRAVIQTRHRANRLVNALGERVMQDNPRRAVRGRTARKIRF